MTESHRSILLYLSIPLSGMFVSLSCSSDSPNPAPPAKAVRQRAFSDGDKELAIDWARRLDAAIKAKPALLANVPDALSYKKEWPRWEAELRQLPHGEEVFIELLATKDDRVNPIYILKGLDYIATSKSLPVLNSILEERDTRAQDCATEIILHYAWPEATPLIWNTFFSDEDVSNRHWAAEVLLSLRAKDLVEGFGRRIAVLEKELAETKGFLALAREAEAAEASTP